MRELKINFPVDCSFVCWQVVELAIKSLGEPGVDALFNIIISVGEIVPDVLVYNVIRWSEEILFWHWLKFRTEKTQRIHFSSYLALLLSSQGDEFTFG
jgi:hypothetical protein